MTYPDTTAIWEKSLKEVAQGSKSFEEFYQNQLRGLSELLEKAKSAGISSPASAVLCPNCGKPMVRRNGKNGYFWGCSGYPACRSTAQDVGGKPVFERRMRNGK